ncbi:GNAT family N-acetyltransferase [Allorhizocola rhizosphaerae]|uniref:GNAT family N-acetyltransferase n=1 Tax=Allorhizocola rhizosphaerae TaxID=1872709 RepID=UPI000E3C8096|nr:GNAT family N-acetyltransferase [Allorhizocola rhizosphaerae]
MDGPEIYVRNAGLMWPALGAHIAHEDDDLVRFELPRVVRVLMRRPMPEMPGHRDPSRPVTIEDPWAARPVGRRMPVMDRAPGPVQRVDIPGVNIGVVKDADELAQAERVMVDGFPLRAYQPLERGDALPPRVLNADGLTVWLARRHGEPAAAGFTYDDGLGVGVYWLATSPAHRSHGLGRAVLTEMLAAHRDRTATPVATEAGQPLYRSLGFTTVSITTWVRHDR